MGTFIRVPLLLEWIVSVLEYYRNDSQEGMGDNKVGYDAREDSL